MVVAIWTVVGLVQVADEGVRPGRVEWVATTSVFWALATLVILAAALRWPIRSGHVWKRAAAFVGLGLIVALFQDIVGDVARDLFLRSGRHDHTLLSSLGRHLGDEVTELHESELMIYGLVLGASFLRGAWQRLRAQEVQTLELESRLSEARLSALRMQLNPHFFFNALNTISGLIDTDSGRARRVIARLGDLMRATLAESEQQEVPLSKELELLDAYLDVVQARFGDRLRVDVDVEAGCQRALVPELILQPLVENAVRHGIEQTEGEGRLTVRAGRGGGRLVLEVSDNGPGLPEAGMAEEGVGLKNVRERLERLYGDDHAWALEPVEGGRLRARIELPFHTSGELYAGA